MFVAHLSLHVAMQKHIRLLYAHAAFQSHSNVIISIPIASMVLEVLIPMHTSTLGASTTPLGETSESSAACRTTRAKVPVMDEISSHTAYQISFRLF